MILNKQNDNKAVISMWKRSKGIAICKLYKKSLETKLEKETRINKIKSKCTSKCICAHTHRAIPMFKKKLI